MQITFHKTTKLLLGAIFFIFLPFCAQAENPSYSIRLDQATIEKGYTVSAFENKIKLSLVPGILSSSTRVEVIELREPMPKPWQLLRVSPVYQFEFKEKSAYDNHKPFYIQLSYDESAEEIKNHKQVFFYDKNFNSWRPLPTKDFWGAGFVRSRIHLSFARIAVFEYPQVISEGKASWYKYKGGDFAASPDFPKGSIIRAHNTANNKFIDVKINDYGPDRGLFPDRAIDLDKIAFSKIASIRDGIIDVRLEPLKIEPKDGRILKISQVGAVEKPKIKTKSAISINDKTNKIYFEKIPQEILPVASFAKLVAAKVFIDTRPSLNQAIVYKEEDGERANSYVDKPWRLARIELEDGAEVTIEDLLYASLVGSANNTTETLVRISGLSREDFLANMNKLAESWGATSTRFIDPNGLDDGNISSASDYAIITKEVYRNPIIQKASVKDRYEFELQNRDKKFKVRNNNKIIFQNNYNITGSKTGYTDESGYSLMLRAAINREENLTLVLIGNDSWDELFQEAEEILRYSVGRIK